MFRRVAALDAEAAQPGRRALASLLAVGEDVIAERGYRGTRVEDLVAAAGLSRGAFYRYFENVHEFVRIVATRALRDMTGAVTRVSELTSRSEEHTSELQSLMRISYA